MSTIKVTKGWIEQYFGIKIERPEQYSSYWQTDGGTATKDFDKLPEDEYEMVHRAPSKTYWGKYVHPTVPSPPFGAEQHTQRRTATYGDADQNREQIIAGWKAGGQIGEKTTTKSNDPDYGRDYRIEVKGLILIPSSPTILYITEQAKWDANISPTVPSNYQPRYWKSLLVTEQDPEYMNNKEEFKWWKLLKDKVAGIVKRHESNIPKGALPQISAGVLKTGYKVEDELSPEANKIVGVGIYFGRGIYNSYIVSENAHQDVRFNRTIIRYSISEMGSSFVEKLLNRYPNRAFIESFYNSISNLVDTYQVFLLGKEGLREYYATIDDRRLVDAISHGAKMDEEGYIVDPVTGDRF
jgi:hypothetical protein